MMRNIRTARFVLTMTCATIILQGCANYPAVGSLASGMKASVGAWTPTAADYQQSCIRRESYAPALNVAAAPCDNAVLVSRGLDGLLTELVQYFGALSAVATDSNFTVDPGIDTLAAAATDQLKLDADKTAAVVGLAKVLAGIATASIRERTVNDLIGQSGNAIIVVEAVQTVINRNYALAIDNESEQWRNVALLASGRANLRILPCSGSAVSPLPGSPGEVTVESLLFHSYYADRCNALLQRRAAIAAFEISANDVKQSLRDLDSSKSRLKDKQVVAAFYMQARKLFTQARAVRKAFGTETNNG